jgi:hypothetical protein
MTTYAHTVSAAAAVAALSLFAVACGDDASTTSAASTTTTAQDEPVIDPGDGGVYEPEIDPARFVDVIDNPYLPFRPGERWVYEGESDGELERIEVTVLEEHREVMGISATVVRDTVSVDGVLFEDTHDWYAQDRDGNVWYLGEETAEYEDGEVVSTEGSWEAGVDGALPGIVMHANPEVGDAYRQEYYEGEAEDLAEVVRDGGKETVPAGAFDDVIVIEEWNPLDPEAIEEKSFAPGVGMVLEVMTRGGEARIELIEHAAPG